MADSGEGSPTRQKKTKRADDQGLSLKLPGLTPPQVVQQICTEGTALKWDDAAGCYQVLDGDEFERRFDQLRSKHERGEGAQTAKRIFSTMSRYYTILPGSRGYAKTGCKFREKEDSTAVKQPIANEKAVGDGAPCGYACVFSHNFRQKAREHRAREHRAARASACVIGSR